MSMRNNGKGVRTRMQKSRFQVSVPYSTEFLEFAHTHDGRWRSKSHFWSFPRYRYPEVARKCNELYGTEFQLRDE